MIQMKNHHSRFSKIAFILIVFFFALQLKAQVNDPQASYVRQRKINSFQQIFDLKNGALLVMLHARQNKINSLVAAGLLKEAEKVYVNQIKKNKGIANAFKKKFFYCPVYFFWNTDGQRLIEYGIDSVNFLNDSLIIDKSIRPGSQHILVSEFGIYAEGVQHNNSTVNQSEPRKLSSNTPSSLAGVEGLIIEDINLNALQKPFPFYLSIVEDEDRIFIVDEVVSKLNENFYSFNRTASRRILKPKFYKYFNKN